MKINNIALLTYMLFNADISLCSQNSTNLKIVIATNNLATSTQTPRTPNGSIISLPRERAQTVSGSNPIEMTKSLPGSYIASPKISGSGRSRAITQNSAIGCMIQKDSIIHANSNADNNQIRQNPVGNDYDSDDSDIDIDGGGIFFEADSRQQMPFEMSDDESQEKK